jgi:hypothetical protein
MQQATMYNNNYGLIGYENEKTYKKNQNLIMKKT